MGTDNPYHQFCPSGPTWIDPPVVCQSPCQSPNYGLKLDYLPRAHRETDNRLTPPLTPRTPSTPPFPSRLPLKPSSTYPQVSPHSPPRTNTQPGFFTHAHNFVLNNPTFVDHIIHHDGASGYPSLNATGLWDLGKHGYSGAEFDSSDRDPPPRCHPHTRSRLISKLLSWVRNPERQHSLAWLHGPAGVGKSAIMQSLAEDLSSSVWLGATLFFSKLNGRSEPSRIIPTISYQLSIRIPAYRAFISKLLDDDPTIPQKSLQHQFSRLISEPFRTHCGGNQTRLVLIDGLEECDSETAQRQLVSLISAFTKSTTCSPLIWIISSRPEHHLRLEFELPRTSCDIHDIPVDGTEACADIEKFLRKEFEKIHFNYPETVPEGWPSSRQFLAIAKAANGLFAFAVTVMAFIADDTGYGDPVAQLNTVVSVLDSEGQAEHPSYSQNPLFSLDNLYTHILSKMSADSIQIVYSILGFYALRSHSPSPSIVLVANILGMQQHTVYSSLQRLHSVLDIPRLRDAHKKPLRFHHKSFSDFIYDFKRSSQYWLDRGKYFLWISHSYVHKFETILNADSGGQPVPLSWPHPAETNLRSRIVTEVKQNTFHILTKIVTWHYFHEPELQALIEAIGKLRFNAFDVQDALGFINLINWIATDSPPIWRQLIFQETSWATFSNSLDDSIDTTKPSVYYRTRPDCWGYWSNSPIVHSTIIPSRHQRYLQDHSLSKDDFFRDFWELETALKYLNPRVLIVGSEHTRCAVVLTSVEKQEVQPVVRYYFPLKGS